MSTPEHPATPALTRKQMREIRNTGATPVITATPPSDDAGPAPAQPAPSVPVSAAPLPRPAEPAAIPPPPVADSAVDLGVSPLTRRQARQQEKIRTASVPVITPEVVAAHAAASTSVPSFAPPVVPAPAPAAEPKRSPFTAPDDADAPVGTESGMHALFGLPRTQSEPDTQSESVDSSIWARPSEATPQPQTPAAETEAALETPVADALDETDDASIRDVLDTNAGDASDESEHDEPQQPKAVVSPLLGASLLGGDPAPAAPVAAPDLPASFDQLLSRSTGAISAPNALIVSQAPEVSPLVGPVTATGEVLVTGTFNLPEGLGSTGHAKGTADGKEIDATLVDGELPSHSSPTPIAASAAVSTVKMPGEVIKPPTPEKGSRLMMSLAITAGVLAIALVGVLILAFVTGAL